MALVARLGHAQLDAEIGLERDSLLLYEPIRVLVQLTNFSSQPLDPARTSGEKLWLEIFVTRADDTAVLRTGQPWLPPSAVLMPGQKRTVASDILPAFQVREPGNYRIHARVNYANRAVAARVIRFSVDRGTPVWQQQVTLPPEPGADPARPRARAYSLLVHRGGDTHDLFARIQDPQEERVYCTTRIGPYVNSSDLQVKVDREGGLHVFQRSGARVFRYSRFSVNGKPSPQRLFSDLGSSPRLVSLANDSVDVVGGEEVVSDGKGGRVDDVIPTAPVGQPPKSRSAPATNRNGF
jgi:hypothetical protein